MDSQKRKQLNMQVLKRIDPLIVDILDQSAHVVLYDFQENSWKKLGVEGTLFVYVRSSYPAFGYMVLNRLSLDNYNMLIKDIEFELLAEYVISTMQDRIHGIWVYEQSDRVRIAQLLTGLGQKEQETVKLQQMLQFQYSQSSVSTPLTPSVRSIQHLGDVWQILEEMTPSVPRGRLSDVEFKQRIAVLLQNTGIADSLFRCYLNG
jgi:mRNA-decapping enzyme 1B